MALFPSPPASQDPWRSVCVCGSARVPTRHPLGRAAAVRVRVPLRRRAPVRGPPRTYPRREQEGAILARPWPHHQRKMLPPACSS
ncbi:hypothetical protein MUG91_G83n128 [Manis pentadactyla]|nr:hypothetical protein MUG91_G83n128 [Manis pentadactyla]